MRFIWIVGACLPSLAPACAAGDSGDNGGGAGNVGQGGAQQEGGAAETSTLSDAGGVQTDSGGSAGYSPCAGISGTYAVTRTRSSSQPGSCPPGYDYSPNLPCRVTADSTEASGYRLEVGYTNRETQEVEFVRCVNNVTGCKLFATCHPNVGTDDLAATLEGDSLSGTLTRQDTKQSCTVEFDLKGKRE